MSENRVDKSIGPAGVDEGRRRLIKALGLGAGGIAASALVPDKWVKPGINLGTLPALAQTSVVLGTGDLQVTVTWDTDCTDIDTFVEEPDGFMVYYSDDIGPTATLDVDDTDGFGPENVFVGPGMAASGVYKVYVAYYDYGCGGELEPTPPPNPPATTVTIRITVFDGTPQKKQQTFTRELTVADYDDTLCEVAWVDFPSGNITEKAECFVRAVGTSQRTK